MLANVFEFRYHDYDAAVVLMCEIRIFSVVFCCLNAVVFSPFFFFLVSTSGISPFSFKQKTVMD